MVLAESQGLPHSGIHSSREGASTFLRFFAVRFGNLRDPNWIDVWQRWPVEDRVAVVASGDSSDQWKEGTSIWYLGICRIAAPSGRTVLSAT